MYVYVMTMMIGVMIVTILLFVFIFFIAHVMVIGLHGDNMHIMMKRLGLKLRY